MEIMWCGTATLLVRGGGTTLLFDPYLRRTGRGAPFPMAEAARVDAVFVTHPHLDHFADIGAFLPRPVYVSPRGIRLAERSGTDTSSMRPVHAGETVRVGGLSVTAYRGRHCAFDAQTVARVLFSPRTWLHLRQALRLLRQAKAYAIPPDDVLIYLVTDGIHTVTVLGSAGMAAGEEYPRGSDLFVFPYQGRARMHREILPFLDVFAPKAVMIDHFDDAFPPVSTFVDHKKFPAAVKKRLPSAAALVPAYTVWYDLPVTAP